MPHSNSRMVIRVVADEPLLRMILAKHYLLDTVIRQMVVPHVTGAVPNAVQPR